MYTNRREFLTGISGLVALTIPGANSETLLPPRSVSSPVPAFPAKNDFNIPDSVTYLNCAYTHPMPAAAAKPSVSIPNFVPSPTHSRSNLQTPT